MEKSVTEVIEEVKEDICNNYCKYIDTTDDNAECEVLRSKKSCPLDRL